MNTTLLLAGINQLKVKTNRLEADCGHSPHIEKQAEFLEFFTDFIME